MHDGEAFHRTMTALLQQLGIRPLPHATDECYEVRFSDDSRIYFANVEPGTIDAVAEAGEMAENSPAAAALLALNLAEPGRPLLTIGYDRSTCKLLVRARIGMQDAQGEGLRKLAWQMLERVNTVRACLDATRQERKTVAVKPGSASALHAATRAAGVRNR